MLMTMAMTTTTLLRHFPPLRHQQQSSLPGRLDALQWERTRPHVNPLAVVVAVVVLAEEDDRPSMSAAAAAAVVPNKTRVYALTLRWKLHTAVGDAAHGTDGMRRRDIHCCRSDAAAAAAAAVVDVAWGRKTTWGLGSCFHKEEEEEGKGAADSQRLLAVVEVETCPVVGPCPPGLCRYP